MPSSFYRRHHHHHQHHYHHHSHLFNFIVIFIIVFINFIINKNCLHKNTPTACRRVLWILLVRRCTVCLVLCLCLESRLSPWRGFLPHPPVFFVFVVIVLFVLFVFILCHDVLGSTLPMTRATHAWFWTCCSHFRCFSRFFCCHCVCHLFSASFLMSDTSYRWSVTRHLSIHGLFPKPWFTHSCFGWNSNRGLHNNHVLRTSHGIHKTLFYTKTVLCTKAMFYTKLFLPRSVQVLFADGSFHGGRRNMPKAVKSSSSSASSSQQQLHMTWWSGIETSAHRAQMKSLGEMSHDTVAVELQ